MTARRASAKIVTLADVRRRLINPEPPASIAIAASIGGRRGGPAPYHVGSTNHCPTCGGVSWFVGRATAECAGCGAPLPIISAAARPNKEN